LTIGFRILVPEFRPPLLIKICGITSVGDGVAALEAGADWLGFVRWPKSPRFVETDTAAELAAALRSRATRSFQAVGVYVDADRETIERDVAAIGLDRVQLHGSETPEFARALPWPVIKALRARDPSALEKEAHRYEGLDLLIDAFDPDRPGGTGQSHDYDALADLVRTRRVLIAGGLHPGNVGDIVRRLRPWGVDVSSGVESAPGRKDPKAVRAFIQAARRAATTRP
jgi:phosphoribosylanthranilate isomerase